MASLAEYLEVATFSLILHMRALPEKNKYLNVSPRIEHKPNLGKALSLVPDSTGSSCSPGDY